jgi:hypothetical protein
MDVGLGSLITVAEQFVGDFQLIGRPVQRERSTMNDRRGQPAVPVVRRREADPVVSLLPQLDLRTRELFHLEERAVVDRVYLGACDDHCVVSGSRAKEVARLRVGRIRVRARVDY